VHIVEQQTVLHLVASTFSRAGGEAGGGRGLATGTVAVTDFQKKLTDEACLLRGKIITGYSMVEYVLADISVCLNLKSPYRIKDCIKAVKQIVDQPEYEAYRNDVHRVCNEFPRYEELRLFMAHGLMLLEITPDQTSHRFLLQRYDWETKGEFCRYTLSLSIEALREVASEIVEYTNDAYAVFFRFYNEQALESSSRS
jgi:hypothetical protein